MVHLKPGAPATGPQPCLPLPWTRPSSSRLKPPDGEDPPPGGGGHRGPPRLGGGVGRDDAVGELFGGHELACAYDSDNPFERKRGLQQRTSLVTPAAAGDTLECLGYGRLIPTGRVKVRLLLEF